MTSAGDQDSTKTRARRVIENQNWNKTRMRGVPKMRIESRLVAGRSWNQWERGDRRTGLNWNPPRGVPKIGTELKTAREGYQKSGLHWNPQERGTENQNWTESRERGVQKMMAKLTLAGEGYRKSGLKWNPRERVQYKIAMAVIGYRNLSKDDYWRSRFCRNLREDDCRIPICT
jgi:hypothetical protein